MNRCRFIDNRVLQKLKPGTLGGFVYELEERVARALAGIGGLSADIIPVG